MKDREAVCEKVRAVGLIYQQSVEGDSRDPENKKAREKSGNKHEGNSNVGDDRKYPGWVWRPATLLQQRP
ncbi:hypothetical protein FTO33_27240 [Klebsiella pneumoniae]|jgi:hypothetical protein|uniref:hypothetical protein n=1 Tax=Klebsiella pneumoniae TaxID=573 RepID=UPI000903D52F|nr:hypothetical protein [Klebsiella pneumoniae]ARV39053.1 hypothetical protein RJA_07480 [Klebsiella pneumoniae subsp. pneumoniae]WMJ65411.1 hypothetical protein RBI80_26360 [Klebsiella variicola]KAB0318906.1 hypothetical protein FPQ47_21480 [Klebsiella pneumoniae]KAB1569979.1 hypothetical protein F8D15_02965 [Klebsiella pneumoniae]MCJ7232527.1 hypothetical protein [Klebsiella pneumoniae]